MSVVRWITETINAQNSLALIAPPWQPQEQVHNELHYIIHIYFFPWDGKGWEEVWECIDFILVMSPAPITVILVIMYLYGQSSYTDISFIHILCRWHTLSNELFQCQFGHNPRKWSLRRRHPMWRWLWCMRRRILWGKRYSILLKVAFMYTCHKTWLIDTLHQLLTQHIVYGLHTLMDNYI